MDFSTGLFQMDFWITRRYQLCRLSLLMTTFYCIFVKKLNFLIYNSPHNHCVKNVQIRSCFWFVFSCIRTEYRTVQTRNNTVFGHFYQFLILEKINQYAHWRLMKIIKNPNVNKAHAWGNSCIHTLKSSAKLVAFSS